CPSRIIMSTGIVKRNRTIVTTFAGVRIASGPKRGEERGASGIAALAAHGPHTRTGRGRADRAGPEERGGARRVGHRGPRSAWTARAYRSGPSAPVARATMRWPGA